MDGGLAKTYLSHNGKRQFTCHEEFVKNGIVIIVPNVPIVVPEMSNKLLFRSDNRRSPRSAHS